MAVSKLSDRAGIGSSGAVPVGAIMAFDSRFLNVTIPATGTISDAGWALCDGQAVAGLVGNQLGGGVANLPNLTDGRFLRGAASAGGSGGSDTFSIGINNMPSHTHGRGSYQTSIGLNVSRPFIFGSTLFAASGHNHGSGSYHALVMGANQDNNPAGDPGGNSQVFFGRSNHSWTANQQFDTTRGDTTSFTNKSMNIATDVQGFSDAPSADSSFGFNRGSYSLTGSNIVTGNSSSAGSGQAITHRPKYFDAVYLMKVRN